MAFWNLMRDPTLAKLVQKRDVSYSLPAPILSPKYALLTCGQVMVGCHVADGRAKPRMAMGLRLPGRQPGL